MTTPAPTFSNAPSYSGNPTDSDTDLVRFLIQDISATPDLTTAEVNYLIIEEGTGYPAATEACRILARRYAKQPGSKSIGDISISYADLTKRYTELAITLAARSTRSTAPVPYLGGLSASEKRTNESNTDRERVFASDEQWANRQVTGGGGSGGGPSTRY